MEYQEIIYLVNKVVEDDDIGNNTSSFETTTKIYAKKQSVRTNEYYSAVETGITPSYEFVVKRLNYNGQSELNYNNQRFSIIRTVDPKNKFDIVLVCTRKIGVNEVSNV